MKKEKELLVAVASQKGGVGKSVFTVLLASVLHYRKGLRVAVVDCDYPQHSIALMRERDMESVMKNDDLKVSLYRQHERIRKLAYPVIKSDPEKAVFGAAAFWLQGSVRWDGTPVSAGMLLLALLCGMVLLPVWPGAGHEVRGNGEMCPLNGPSWSLFFEYLGNLLYAFLLRRLPTRLLALVVVLSGSALALFAVCDLSGFGHLGVGWTLADYNLPGGLLRMLFSFSAGMLLSRRFRPMHIRGAFWLCSLALALLLAMPYAGSEGNHLPNAIYDSVCVLLLFPLLLWLGASGRATDRTTARICRFLGDISYPVYIVHYPSMYLFYAWVWKHGYTFAQAWPAAAALVAGNIVLAWCCLKFYDEPLRRWLTARFLTSHER